MGELFDIVSAKRVLQSDWQRTGIPFYRAREIVRLSYEGYVDNDLFITEEHYNNLKKSYGVPEPSDIMLSAVGTIGRAYVVRNNDVFYYKDASVLCLRNVYHLNSEFIKWILSSDLLQNQMYENSKGTTVDTITIEKANSYFLPLPPIDEQYRIVKLLCEWDAYINDINKNKEEVLNNIRTCKSKILDLAISGKLVSQDPNDEPAIELLKRINPNFKPCDNSHYENLPFEVPDGWCWAKINDVTEFIKNGAQIKQFKGASGIPITRIETISNSELDMARMGYANITNGAEYKDYYIKDGDILMSHINSRAHIGKCALCNVGENQIIHGMNLLRIRCSKQILPEYMVYYFRSTTFYNLIESHIKNAVNQASINITNLQKILIPIPPYSEQRRVAFIVDKLFSTIDTITAEL